MKNTNRLDIFQKKYTADRNEILDMINCVDPKYSEFTKLVNWFIETDISPYKFLEEKYANWFYDISSFKDLMNIIHHAMYDDGYINFVSIDDEVKIILSNPPIIENEKDFENFILSDFEKGLKERYSIAFPDRESILVVKELNISIEEFIERVENYSKIIENSFKTIVETIEEKNSC